MADFYTRMADTALTLMTSKGKPLSVERTTGGTFNPVTQSFTVPETTTTSTTKGVVVPLTRVEDNRYLQDLVEGKMRRVIVAAQGMSFEPRAGDRVVDGSTVIEVLGSTPVNPAGTAIIHRIIGRVIA